MTDSFASDLDRPFASERWDRVPLYRLWRQRVVRTVDHEAVVARIVEDSGSSARYFFMTMMSVGIAVLGLLLSSPAVVIGAMLISPLMGPILGLGFSLALFDFAEMRRALVAFALGSLAAVAFAALIVVASPLKAPTAEILARTRPNLFDLLVALFAALAGTFAIIRGRGETIVGVAIATALMPPLAVVGYGLATWNLPVLGGSLALFVTNFVTIALAATAMARVYGFGHFLSSQQSWAQTTVLLLVFVVMAIPLGISLGRIAHEAVAVAEVRSVLSDQFGNDSRVTQLDVNFDRKPLRVRAVVIAPRSKAAKPATLEKALVARLGVPLKLQVDQILIDPAAGLNAEREAVQRATEAAATAARIDAGKQVADLVALAAGVAPDAVTLDRDHQRAVATGVALPGASLATYRAIEGRVTAAADGWSVTIVPPLGPLPTIHFADNVDTLDDASRAAVLLSAWAAKRWNVAALAVPGLPDPAAPPPLHPTLSQRRGIAVAALLGQQGIAAVPARAQGQSFSLHEAAPEKSRTLMINFNLSVTPFDAAAILISLAAALGYINLRFFQLPQSIGLTVMGAVSSLVVIGIDRLIPNSQLAPQIVRFISGIDFHATLMDGMLSFLLFAGALHVNWGDMRRGRWPILLLSTGGVILSTVLVGFGFRWIVGLVGFSLPLAWALVFGALISPTDPVAVIQVLKRISVPPTLQATVAGESLFNDGIGVVVFTIIFGSAIGVDQFSFAHAIHLFLLEAGGGIVLGLVTGWIAYRAMRSINDYNVEVMISLAVVMGGYAIARPLGVSGPVAMAAAGLLIGNKGVAHAMSDESKDYLIKFWTLIDDILNAVLFLLIGLEVVTIPADSRLLLIGIAAIPLALAARAISVLAPLTILRPFLYLGPEAPLTLIWGGLRGGISVALVLGLPNGPPRAIALAATYIIVLFAVIVQGGSIGRLLAWRMRNADPEGGTKAH